MFSTFQNKTREKLHPHVLQTIRILQFVAALISIILYIVYVVRQATTSSGNGAVLGILAGGIVFTLFAIGKACIVKRKVAMLVLLFMVVDILFVAAYIAVAVLSRGTSCGIRNSDDDDDDDEEDDDDDDDISSTNCNLEKGVFALAIINILQHLISSALEQFSKPPNNIKHPTRSGNLFNHREEHQENCEPGIEQHSFTDAPTRSGNRLEDGEGTLGEQRSFTDAARPA
ncbi:MAG: hypothetical protein Q9169_006264 [Polycauliona sp. 2 TL-2023]